MLHTQPTTPATPGSITGNRWRKTQNLSLSATCGYILSTELDNCLALKLIPVTASELRPSEPSTGKSMHFPSQDAAEEAEEAPEWFNARYQAFYVRIGNVNC